MALEIRGRRVNRAIRAGVALAAVLAMGAPLAVAAHPGDKELLELPDGDNGEAIMLQLPADWDGREKVLDTYCRSNKDSGYYLIVYNVQITDISICYEASIDVTRGDTDLYQTYQEPWNNATVPPSEGGTLICSSTGGGTADEYCNGCSLGWCIYPVSGVWRNYAYVYSGPSDFCLTADSYYCTDVDVSAAKTRRDGLAMQVSWEVTSAAGVAGYNLWRRLDETTGWAQLNPTLIAVRAGGSYEFDDQLPAGTGDVEYRVEQVSLDGSTEFLVRLIDRSGADRMAP